MEIEQIYELTEMQSGILYHCIAENAVNIYLEQYTFVLADYLIESDILSAWEKVIAHNEILRGFVRWKKVKHPILVIEKNKKINVEILDSVSYATIQDAVLADRERGIDIEHEAYRISLYQDKISKYMIVTSHHIFLDGWSSALILKEFMQCCLGEKMRKHFTYEMFISDGKYKETDSCIKFWKKKMSKIEEPMLLSNKKGCNDESVAVIETLDKRIACDLEIFLSRSGYSISTLVYAAWGLYLGYYNVQDVVFGVTMSGRERNGTIYDDVAGVLINTIPFIMEIDRSDLLLDYIEKISQQQYTFIVEYGNMPLERIASYHRDNKMTNVDLFNTLVVVENYPLPKQAEPLLEVFDIYETTHYDITLQASCLNSEYVFKLLSKRDSYSSYELRQIYRILSSILDMMISKNNFTIQQMYETLSWVFPKSERMNICASFVCEPMKEVLSGWMKKFNLPSKIKVEEYNSAFTNLLLNLSNKRVAGDINIAILSLDDLIHYQNNHISSMQMIDEVERILLEILNSSAWENDLILCLIPSDSCRTNDVDITKRLKRVENILLSTKANPHVRVLSLEKYIKLYQINEIYDLKLLDEYHIPYKDSYFTIIATAVARVVVSLLGNVFKVIVTDCDNTLWKGICGETNGQNVVVDSEAAEVQKNLLKLKNEGFLLCINSKNNEQDVWNIFDNTPSMLLTRNDFIAYRMHWGNKSDAMQSMAEELNLSLDSFIFIDDNITECIDMANRLPQILTLLLPSTYNEIKCMFAHVWAFDRPLIDNDDVYRTERYQQEFSRKNMRKSFEYEEEYLQALHLKAYVGEYDSSEYLRVVDLSRRVTQFTNMNGFLNIAEISDSAEKYIRLWTIYFEDAFGEYGLVGGILFKIEGDVIEIQRMFISCRSTGRRLEYYVLKNVLEYAMQRGAKKAYIRFAQTDRNTPFRLFIIESKLKENAYVEIKNIIENIQAMAIVIESIEKKTILKKSYNKIAEEIIINEVRKEDSQIAIKYPEQYLNAMQQSKHGQYIYSGIYVNCIDINSLTTGMKIMPNEKTNASILDSVIYLWKETLNNPNILPDDSFFKVGGTSIKLAMLAGKISNIFDIEISLVDLLEHTTPIEQTNCIEFAVQKRSNYQKVEIPDKYLLSPLQRGIYLRHMIYPNETIYNTPIAYMIYDKINYERMEQALQCAILRHSSMRLRVQNNKDNVLQTIAEIDSTRLLEVLDWSYETESKLSEKLIGLIKPFDIVNGPIFRAVLIHVGDQKNIFFLDIHHIAVDGFSMQVLMRDIINFYQKNTHIESVVQVPYYDCVKKITQNMYNNNADEDMAYWLKQIDDSDLATNLNVLVKDDSKVTAARMIKNIYQNDYTIIKHFLEREGISPYIHCLATLGVLLHIISASERVYIGTPLTMRDIANVENAVGLYINTLPLRLDIKSEEPYQALLVQTQKVLVDALKHRCCTMERLAKEIGTAFRPTNIILTYYDEIPDSIVFNGSRAYAIDLFQGSMEYDMAVLITQKQEGLKIELQYRVGVLEQYDAGAFLETYTHVLLELAKNSYNEIKNISLVDEKNALSILKMSEGRKVFYKSKNLIDLFCEQSNCTPNKIALIHNDKKIKYCELDALSDQYAYNISRQYEIVGKFVVVCMEPSIDQIAVLLAIWKCGGAFIPLSPTIPETRKDAILEQSNSCAIITDQVYEKQSKKICRIDYKNMENHDTIADSSQYLQRRKIAYAIFTSGTTGQPKGCIIEHASISNAIQWRKKYYGFSGKEKSLQVFDCSFDGFFTSLFTPLISGATCVVCDRKDIKNMKKLCALIKKWKVTHLLCVPTLYSELLEYIESDDGKTLDTIVLAGENIPQQLVCRSKRKLPHAIIFNEYGPTENSVVSTAKANLSSNEVIVVGTPIDNVNVFVLGATKQLMPPGLSGEIYLSGSGLLKGYFGDKGKIVSCLVDSYLGKVYKTGDVGRWTQSGELEIIGRNNSQMKVNGYRVDLTEIENAILSVPGIHRCKTVLVQKGHTSHLVANYIGDSKEDTVMQYLETVLPDYMLPKWYRKMSDFPTLRSGKIDTNALISLGLPLLNTNRDIEKLNDKRYVSIARSIKEIYEKVLATNVSDNDNFFELGGNSITAVELSYLIEKKYGCCFEPNNLYKLFTVNDVAYQIFMQVYGHKELEALSCNKEKSAGVKSGILSEDFDEKYNDNIEPYDNELYIDCFFSMLFSLLRHAEISIEHFLLHFYPVYTLDDKNELVVSYRSDIPMEEILLLYGIKYEVFQQDINLEKKLKDICAAGEYAIICIDRYYMPFVNSPLEHQLHYLLVDSVTQDNQYVSIIDQIANQSLKYMRMKVPMQKLVAAFQRQDEGVQSIMNLQKPPLIQVSLRNATESMPSFSVYIKSIQKAASDIQVGMTERNRILYDNINSLMDVGMYEDSFKKLLKALNQIVAAKKIEQTIWNMNYKTSSVAILSKKLYSQWRNLRNQCVYSKLTNKVNIEKILTNIEEVEMIENIYYEEVFKFCPV